MYNPNNNINPAIQMAIQNLEMSLQSLKYSLGVQSMPFPGTGYPQQQYPGQYQQPIPFPNQPFGQRTQHQNPNVNPMYSQQGFSHSPVPAWVTDIKRDGDFFTITSVLPTGQPCREVKVSVGEIGDSIKQIATPPNNQMEFFQSLKSLAGVPMKVWKLTGSTMLVVVQSLSQTIVNAGKFEEQLPHIPYVDLSGNAEKRPQPKNESQPWVSWISNIELNEVGDLLTTTVHMSESNQPDAFSYNSGPTIQQTSTNENYTLEEFYSHWNDQFFQLNQVYNLIKSGIVKAPKVWIVGDNVVVSIDNVGTGCFTKGILEDLNLDADEVIMLSETVDSGEVEAKATDETSKLSTLSYNELWKWFDKPIQSAQWASESDDANLVLTSSSGTLLELDLPFTKLAEETFNVIDGRSMSAFVKHINRGVGEMVIVQDEHSDLCLVQQVEDKWHSTAYLMDKARASHYAGLINDAKKLKVFPTIV